MAIHRLAQATSTTANWPKVVASVPNTSRMATMLAPPPIQLPASAAMPAQVSPATVSGWISFISWNETMAPSMMPAVPAQNTISSFGPSLAIPLRSIDRVSRTSAAGSSTSRATGLYSEVLWPSMTPAVL